MEIDYATREGAMILCKRIHDYWAKLGHDVDIKASPINTSNVKSNGQAVWNIRSNMINGMPQRSGVSE